MRWIASSLRDELLLHHVRGHLHRGARRPLRRARLEHEELAALDRELEVLRVAIVLLEPLRDLLELRVRLRHVALQLVDLRRGPDAGDHVLALRVHEVLAVELPLAGVRVAGERDAGAGVVAHVAEDHRHDAACRAEVVRDPELLAVVLRARAEPRAEDGLDREAELVVRLGRERLPGLLPDDGLELVDEPGEVLRVELGVRLRAPARFLRFSSAASNFSAGMSRTIRPNIEMNRRYASHAKRSFFVSVARPWRLSSLRPRLRTVSIIPGIDIAAPERTETRSGSSGSPRRFFVDRLDGREAALHLVPEPRRQLAAAPEELVAGGGRDREPGRNGESRVRHLRETGALAAEQRAHLRVALGLSVGEQVDPLPGLRFRNGSGRFLRARGRHDVPPDFSRADIRRFRASPSSAGCGRRARPVRAEPRLPLRLAHDALELGVGKEPARGRHPAPRSRRPWPPGPTPRGWPPCPEGAGPAPPPRASPSC